MQSELKDDIIQWDIKSWTKALDYWEENIDWKGVKTGLELGGRKGGLSLWMALKGIDVIFSDIENREDYSKQLFKKYNVENKVNYQNIDATNIPYENHFDIITFKSILGGIGHHDNFQAQQQTIKEIHKALKKGGKLLFAENLVGSFLHSQMRKRFVSWGKDWRYVTIDETKSLFEDFARFDFKTTGVLATFGRSELQRNLLSHFDDIILNKVCPDSWKYIVYGIAEK